MRHPSRLIPVLVLPAFLVALSYVLASEGEITSPQVFSATVNVIPSAPVLRVGESLSVAVSISVSEGCRFPIYELTLGQSVPVFEYTFPSTATVGPPVSNPFTYTLTAIATGTVTLDALAYGERYCDDFWNWTYLGGQSEPVKVWEEKERVNLPLVLRDY